MHVAQIKHSKRTGAAEEWPGAAVTRARKLYHGSNKRSGEQCTTKSAGKIALQNLDKARVQTAVEEEVEAKINSITRHCTRSSIFEEEKLLLRGQHSGRGVVGGAHGKGS